MIGTAPRTHSELAVLVGVITPAQPEHLTIEYLAELDFLTDTAGAKVVKHFTQRLPHPDPRTYVGSGKLQEINDHLVENSIDLVIFDDELSAAQIRNIEKVFNPDPLEATVKVLDRSTLILDIFASRARTAQSRLQVELAQHEYLLPRLTRMWTHLSKQKGGIGMKGPGEKEIETDRRIIRYRISLLQGKLKEIDRQNQTQRKNRQDQFRVALVGYTNVGKSSLMNWLTRSEVFAENKLFATLDTTVRKWVINDRPLLLSDTVGFIRKLPHHLVESFKSTLDEAREAHLLLHVIDASHLGLDAQIAVVEQTLVELGILNTPVIRVYNKMDAVDLESADLRSWQKSRTAQFPQSVFVSAQKHEGQGQLKSMVEPYIMAKPSYVTS
ncbi:MAG: GTPase HflX [Sphingomonadales bacterium]|nr:GTPase HflX [Sphingomonadales bacterium]